MGRSCGCTQAWQLGATGLGDVGFLGRWHEDFCAPGLCLGCVSELGTWGLGGGCKWLCLNSDSSVQHGGQVQTGRRVLSLMSQHQLGECHVLGPGPAFLEPLRGLEFVELGDAASG